MLLVRRASLPHTGNIFGLPPSFLMSLGHRSIWQHLSTLRYFLEHILHEHIHNITATVDVWKWVADKLMRKVSVIHIVEWYIGSNRCLLTGWYLYIQISVRYENSAILWTVIHVKNYYFFTSLLHFWCTLCIWKLRIFIYGLFYCGGNIHHIHHFY